MTADNALSTEAEPVSAAGPTTSAILATPRRFSIRPAVRGPSPLLLGLSGPSGAGKTYSALRLATGMQRIAGGEIVVLDTENGRARHYADRFHFQHVDMPPPFGSDDFAAALDAIVATRPGVIIIDTLSHEHDGEGGMLDYCASELDRLAGEDPALQQRMQKAAWRRPRAARRALLFRLMRLKAHCILCFRAVERSRTTRDGPSDGADSGFMPIAGAEFIYETTCSVLLRPGHQGAPLWASTHAGEQTAIKLPGQFAKIFGSAKPDALTEDHGEAMARWAHGEPSPPVASPRRRRGARKGAADDAPIPALGSKTRSRIPALERA